MTMFNQDFSMFAGESRTVSFDVLDANDAMMDLTGATLTWRVSKLGVIIIERVADVTGVGKAQVRIEVADNIQQGTYVHELELAKAADKETVCHGSITVLA